jgi:small-conductance mechanosensitive channel
MLQYLEHEIFTNPVSLWLLAVAVAIIVLLGAAVTKTFLLARLPERQPGEEMRWRTVLRDLLARTSSLFLFILAVHIGISLLTLPGALTNALFSIFVIALFIQIAVWGDRLVSAAVDWQLAPWRTRPSMRNALSVIHFLLRVAVWSLALLLIFENLGFDVTALVAGLGIGGVAVALAAQSILGDLFASLAIVLDRPFEVGDFIVFGDDQRGTVERIGIKTTRIRSLSGEQIVCSNSDLLNSRIRNFKRMAERRVLFSIGVTYETPSDKLERIPEMIKEIVEGEERTRFDRSHFESFGESALTFETVYWVLSPDFNVYMDIQQSINFAIVRRFEESGISFAYPTRTLQIPELDRAILRPDGRDDGRRETQEETSSRPA